MIPEFRNSRASRNIKSPHPNEEWARRFLALHCSGGGRSASVCSLHVAHIEVVVGEYRTADRADENRLVLDAEFFNAFGDQLVNDTVTASRTVVRLVAQIGLPLVSVVENRRLLVSYVVVAAGFRIDDASCSCVLHDVS